MKEELWVLLTQKELKLIRDAVTYQRTKLKQTDTHQVDWGRYHLDMWLANLLEALPPTRLKNLNNSFED